MQHQTLLFIYNHTKYQSSLATVKCQILSLIAEYDTLATTLTTSESNEILSGASLQEFSFVHIIIFLLPEDTSAGVTDLCTGRLWQTHPWQDE